MQTVHVTRCDQIIKALNLKIKMKISSCGNLIIWLVMFACFFLVTLIKLVHSYADIKYVYRKMLQMIRNLSNLNKIIAVCFYEYLIKFIEQGDEVFFIVSRKEINKFIEEYKCHKIKIINILIKLLIQHNY